MTTDMSMIRPATGDDLPACAAIINNYIDETDWLPRLTPREEIAALFSPEMLKTRQCLVAETDGRIVGYLTMTSDGFVPAVYLIPEMRGQRVGKALIDRAKELSNGCVELTVFERNQAALRFYAREGFRPVAGGRNEDTPEGVPTLRFRWEAVP